MIEHYIHLIFSGKTKNGFVSFASLFLALQNISLCCLIFQSDITYQVIIMYCLLIINTRVCSVFLQFTELW